MNLQLPGGRERGTLTQSSHEKLLLCHSNLVTRLEYIDYNSLNTDLQRRIHQALDESLSALGRSLNAKEIGDDPAWIEVYKIEQQIGQLLSGERLKREIEARLGEVQSIPGTRDLKGDYEKLEEKLSVNKDLQQEVSAETEAEMIRRDFLRRLLEHSQWYYRTQYIARPIYLNATRDMLLLVLSAMALVCVPYIAMVLSELGAIAPFLMPARTWEIVPIYTALSVGFLGACFSRLILLQRNWNMSLDEVLLQREASYMWLRAVFGACGALIVFFFLRSGIVSGPLIPNLAEASIQEIRPAANGLTSVVVPMVLVPSPALALLMVWSFIAGFSEALVPTILTRTEGQLSSAAPVEKK